MGQHVGHGHELHPVTSKAATNLTVYGRVPSGQDANVGNYSDSVVATIDF